MAAEAIVSTILRNLTSLIIGEASEAWSLVTGVEQEVRRLESNFEVLQYELADAEEKQYLHKPVKLWLDRFIEVAYDMEDVLEDWKMALQQLQTVEGGVETSSASVTNWKVPPCLSCMEDFLIQLRLFFGSSVVRRYNIATRIKRINEHVDQIAKDRVKFEFMKREIKQPRRQDSTSFVDVSKLHGRYSAKEYIVSALLLSEGETSKGGRGSDVPTISLIGMGGLGKTTLAQHVYHDPRIQTHFDLKIWVCVSDSFDQIQIAQAIVGVLDPSSSHAPLNPKLEPLLTKIRTKIGGKKFFLVLDDVWEDNAEAWEQFQIAFQSGLLGSKILVTSRNGSVADKISRRYRVFYLDLLSTEECWLILEQVAFSQKEKNKGEKLEDIGWEIAKRCNGLPLVAKTLGGVLGDKLRRQEWQDVLYSEIWKLDIVKKDVFAPLLLSYYDLPSPIRRCLLYCAIFPKDYRIDKDELIQHWMAQGYLSSGEKSPTEMGEDYYNRLAAHSFFHDFDDSRIEGPSFKMHDVIHEFLLFSATSGFVEKVFKLEDSTLDLSPQITRHLRLQIPWGSDFPTSFRGTERLRSLVTLCYSHWSDVSLQELLKVARHLRLLEFGMSCHLNLCEIPDIIGKSIHLRYLGLRGSQIRELPEAVCELGNLETLDLRNSLNLEKLPDRIEELINLRYLYTEGCKGLTYYPKGIGRLMSLVVLDYIIIRVDRNDTKEFSIGDFENLNFLRGDLYVQLAPGFDAIDGKEVERAKLNNKKYLNGLYITNLDADQAYQVIPDLNLPPNLCAGIRQYEEAGGNVQARNRRSNLHARIRRLRPPQRRWGFVKELIFKDIARRKKPQV